MSSVTHPTVTFSDFLRSSKNSVYGLPLKTLGKGHFEAKWRDFTVSGLKKEKKHDYPWTLNPNPNVKGGVLTHVQKMANETDQDFTEQISLDQNYNQMNFCSKIASQTLVNEIKRDSDKNIIMSPLSINAILNMIAAGSSGLNLEKFQEFLEIKNIKDLNSQFSEFIAITRTKINRENQNVKEGPLLSFVNGVWVSKHLKLKNSYEKIVKTVYKAEAQYIDFSKADEAVKEVNAWAKSASKGLITNILKPYDITEYTQLILGNALYFKGSWVKPFECKLTKEKVFYLLNGDKIKTPFMTGCTKYTYGSFKEFQVVQIPYEMGDDTQRQFSMYIFLPNEKNGLQRLLEKANSDSGFLAKYTELQNLDIDEFWIPKFKFTYFNEELLATMEKLGLSNVEMSEIVSHTNPLVVSKIIQKAYIEIDEKGSEAVAVTVVPMIETCAWIIEQQPITFVADHPFMFTIIEEKSGLVFFTGAVLNPLQE